MKITTYSINIQKPIIKDETSGRYSKIIPMIMKSIESIVRPHFLPFTFNTGSIAYDASKKNLQNIGYLNRFKVEIIDLQIKISILTAVAAIIAGIFASHILLVVSTTACFFTIASMILTCRIKDVKKNNNSFTDKTKNALEVKVQVKDPIPSKQQLELKQPVDEHLKDINQKVAENPNASPSPAANQIAISKEIQIDKNTKRKVLLMRERIIRAIKTPGRDPELKDLIEAPNSLDRSLLKILGYNIPISYGKSDLAYKNFCQKIINSIDRLNFTCCQDITNFLEKTALEIRLAQINSEDPNFFEKFNIALTYFKSIILEVKYKKLEIPKEIFAEKFPILAKKLNDRNKSIQQSQHVNLILDIIVLKFKNFFENSISGKDIVKFFESSSMQNFKNIVTEKLDHVRTLNLEKLTGTIKKKSRKFKKVLNFYERIWSLSNLRVCAGWT